ncbi:hypothetical protein BH11BAC7_BH11BAC7_20250 [soil metagenome]
MKKTFLFSGVCIFSFLVSCSSDATDKRKTDSIIVKNDSALKILNTDSGKLEITTTPGWKESEATLYSEDGKITQQGKFFENKPAGAWVKYDAAGKIISAYHYSNGKPIHKLDPEDFNFVTCAKPGFGATFSVPANWTETPSPAPSQLAAFSKNVTDPNIKLHPNFNFRHEKLHAGDSLEGLANMQLQILHENVGRVDLVEKSNFIVDGCKATRQYGMFSEETGTVGFLSAIIISGNEVWFFSCEAQNNKPGDFLNYQGVFQQILESFKKAKQ